MGRREEGKKEGRTHRQREARERGRKREEGNEDRVCPSCSEPQCYFDSPSNSPASVHRKASVIMVDELLSACPHQLSFSEAGLRIMITSHFPPKTRLSMASRMLINEVSGKAGLGNLGKGREFPSLKAGAPNSWSDATKSLSHFPDPRSLGQLSFLVLALPSTS